ncbi:MAG: hypothetical protein ACTSXE_03035 [Candidatus Thorarchaeota archaeon]
MILALLAIYGPYAGIYLPITVEIVGAFIGILLALSLTEIVKHIESQDRKKELLKNLNLEVSSFYDAHAGYQGSSAQRKGGYMQISTDIWQMGITSGDITLLNSDIREKFRVYYHLAKNYNEIHKVWLAIPNRKEGEGIENFMCNFLDLMIWKAEEILNIPKKTR